jgi:F-type H+-transporting ATPase subunit delta
MSTAPEARENAQRAMPATVFDDEAAAGARAYAEAFLNAAEKDGQVDAALGELEEALSDVFVDHPRFAELLIAGGLPEEQRDRLLVTIFEGRALPVVARFVRVLNRHGRLGLLGTIVQQARQMWDRRQNRRQVTVRSAAPLDDGQRAALRDRLATMLAAEPVVRYEVDPALIGGLVVQAGDVVYDTSVRAQLERMRREIVRGRVHEVRDRLAAAVTA